MQSIPSLVDVAAMSGKGLSVARLTVGLHLHSSTTFYEEKK